MKINVLFPLELMIELESKIYFYSPTTCKLYWTDLIPIVYIGFLSEQEQDSIERTNEWTNHSIR